MSDSTHNRTVVTYRVKTVYGRDLIYLADPARARAWKHLSGRKTLDATDLRQLEMLTGVKFEQVF